jgi:hypothetical protein
VLDRVAAVAGPYLDPLAERKVFDSSAAPQLADLGGPLPGHGRGTMAAIDRVLETGKRS